MESITNMQEHFKKSTVVIYLTFAVTVTVLVSLVRQAIGQSDRTNPGELSLFATGTRAVDLLAEIMPADELADFAIMRSAEFEAVLEKLKSPEEKQQDLIALFAITHPVEFALNAPPRTAAQIQADELYAQAILNPQAFEQELRKHKDQAQIQLEEKAAFEILHPELNPLPAPMTPTFIPEARP